MSAVQNTERAAPQYPIESVDRALRLVALFRQQPQLRLSVARAHLGVGQSTAHRLMAMLVYHGFAVQDPQTKVYRAGPALFEIGFAVMRDFDLRSVGRPIMEELAALSSETVHLGTLEGASIRYVDCIESASALRVGSRVGQLGPAHATSLGKAMLATLSDEAVSALFLSEQLPVVTARTTTLLTELSAELEQIRECGYARNIEEMEEGVCSVGVAVIHPLRGLVGGLSIAAPVLRMPRDRLDELSGPLMGAARQLAATI